MLSNTRIIGIGHKARQGKDTLARELVKVAGANGIYAKQYGFADALKAHCRVAFGMTSKNSRLLQIVGTELYKDHVSRTFWVDILRNTIVEDQPEVAIISDVRFPDEAEFVKSVSGVTVRVKRYTQQADGYVEFTATDRDPNHRSEVALDGDSYWDYTISNDGGLTDLQKKAKQFFNTEISRAR